MIIFCYWQEKREYLGNTTSLPYVTKLAHIDKYMHTCTIIYLSYRHLFLIISPRNDFPWLARYTSIRHYGNNKSVNKEIGSIQHYLKNYNIIMASEAKSSIPKLFCEITEWIDDMRSWPNLMYGDIYNYIITSKAVGGEEMKNFKSLQSCNYF